MIDLVSIFTNPIVVDSAIKGVVTVIGKTATESSLKLLGDTGGELVDATGKLTKKAQDLFFRISRKYIENYAQRHGTLKVLGMNEPVSLDSVYIKVNFSPKIINYYQSMESLEGIFRERKFKEDEKRSGIEVANEKQYLMVLGNPGGGKTTFLRKLGLEALKGKKHGEYQHICIPVLLELRKYRTGEINLISEIAQEFANCGLPEYEKLTEEFLAKGRLLILFDGLDEVPKEQIGKMSEEIRNLRDKYSKNRFVASCRIAAYRNFDNFRNFTDVVVADFEPEQVQAFINKWFESHKQPDWGKYCWEKLNSEEYEATKELTKTPLLLTLICLLFYKTGQFPTNRATLYERTLRVLLEEWDASKQIPREKIYKGLDTKRKELMLAQIAYENFTENVLFLSGRTVSQQIEKTLKEMLPAEESINGRDVLREVELQHGIIIERQEDIYSFSHLTLHEYLTAVHIVENDINLEDFVHNYLFDKRYREVFLILAGLKKADNLLLAMEKTTYGVMNTPNLKNLLEWGVKVTDTTSGDIQVQGKRALSLANANANANANAYAITYAIAIAYANPNAIAYAITYAYAYANAITYAITYANPNPTANIIVNANTIAYVFPNTYANAIKEFVKYAQWCQKFQVYQGIDFDSIITQLGNLKTKISQDSQKEEIRKALKELINFWLTSFHLTLEMIDLSVEERKAMDNYFYGNLMLVKCKESAVRYSPEVWEKIESRMLLPQK